MSSLTPYKMKSCSLHSFTLAEQLKRGYGRSVRRMGSNMARAFKHPMLVFGVGGFFSSGNKQLFIVLSVLMSSAVIFLGISHETVSPVSRSAMSGVITPRPVIEVPVRDPAQEAEVRKQKALSAIISDRYRIADEASFYIVRTTFEKSKIFKIDPVMMLALMAIESRFNPISESIVGAQGFSQVLPQYHQEKIRPIVKGGGHLLDMSANIHVGMQILREYMNKYKNDEVLALQQYNGTLYDKTRKYSNKVFNEKKVLETAMNAKLVGSANKPEFVTFKTGKTVTDIQLKSGVRRGEKSQDKNRDETHFSQVMNFTFPQTKPSATLKFAGRVN